MNISDQSLLESNNIIYHQYIHSCALGCSIKYINNSASLCAVLKPKPKRNGNENDD